MITIRVEDRAVGDHLKRLQERLGNLEPALKEIGFTLENRIRTRFETQTDPDGRPWAAWRPSTAKVRTQRGGASSTTPATCLAASAINSEGMR